MHLNHLSIQSSVGTLNQKSIHTPIDSLVRSLPVHTSTWVSGWKGGWVCGGMDEWIGIKNGWKEWTKRMDDYNYMHGLKEKWEGKWMKEDRKKWWVWIRELAFELKLSAMGSEPSWGRSAVNRRRCPYRSNVGDHYFQQDRTLSQPSRFLTTIAYIGLLCMWSIMSMLGRVCGTILF